MNDDRMPAALERAVAIPTHGRLVPAHGARVTDCPTNLDLSDDTHKRMAMDAINADTVDLSKDGKVEFALSHYIVTTGEATDPETGETERFPRTALFSEDGGVYVTTSVVVPHRLAAIVDLWGPGPWIPGLPVRLAEKRNKSGKGVYHQLMVVAPA
jgi:hypothetical protein